MAEKPKATVLDQSWGWVVDMGGRRTMKLGDQKAAHDFADALNAGEEWRAAWVRLGMIRWVREKDGGQYRE